MKKFTKKLSFPVKVAFISLSALAMTQAASASEYMEIIDNTDYGFDFTGDWVDANDSTAFNSSHFRIRGKKRNADTAVANWNFNTPGEGSYHVFVKYTSSRTNANNAHYRVFVGDKVYNFNVDQTKPAVGFRLDGQDWLPLGIVHAADNESITVKLSNNDFSYGRFVSADATMLQKIASKGEKGDIGPMGPQGEAGSMGPQGLKGDKGDTGATGTTGASGPKGDKGDTGAAGPKGDKGDTGATGPIGPKGDKGDTGAAGPKGDKGDTGATGPIGPKGDKGDTGALGPKGDKGDTGATGSTGPKGDKGDTGAVGPKGDKGDSNVNVRDHVSFSRNYAVNLIDQDIATDVTNTEVIFESVEFSKTNNNSMIKIEYADELKRLNVTYRVYVKKGVGSYNLTYETRAPGQFEAAAFDLSWVMDDSYTGTMQVKIEASGDLLRTAESGFLTGPIQTGHTSIYEILK